jgi:Ser/Thr protein kinase RdoA (MazF antagonist)
MDNTVSITENELKTILAAFDVPGRFVGMTPIRAGHINDTYRVAMRSGGRTREFVLQRINHHVFKQPIQVMQNIERVLCHIRAQLEAEKAPDMERRCLRLVPARNAAFHHRDRRGEFWRLYHFITGAHTHDGAESLIMAGNTASAFGEFQRRVADLPGDRLSETIPAFHDTPKRRQAFEMAVQEDRAGRGNACRDEIYFVLRHGSLADALTGPFAAGAVPERITHNDTKLNNVMIDDVTSRALCVIDLDTVMPGLALYDFGDMIRSAARVGAEDEPDLSQVGFRMDVFEVMIRNYLKEAGAFLTAAERGLLVKSIFVMTYELGLRFLTDYLAGDTYFKVHHASHNLERSRVQFRLIDVMRPFVPEMERMAAKF